MIDVLFEQRIVQNPGLAAEAIWHSVNEAYDTQGRTEGVSFPLAFLILPLTFHQRSARALAAKTQPGAHCRQSIHILFQGRYNGTS